MFMLPLLPFFLWRSAMVYPLNNKERANKGKQQERERKKIKEDREKKKKMERKKNLFFFLISKMLAFPLVTKLYSSLQRRHQKACFALLLGRRHDFHLWFSSLVIIVLKGLTLRQDLLGLEELSPSLPSVMCLTSATSTQWGM